MVPASTAGGVALLAEGEGWLGDEVSVRSIASTVIGGVPPLSVDDSRASAGGKELSADAGAGEKLSSEVVGGVELRRRDADDDGNSVDSGTLWAGDEIPSAGA